MALDESQKADKLPLKGEVEASPERELHFSLKTAQDLDQHAQDVGGELCETRAGEVQKDVLDRCRQVLTGDLKKEKLTRDDLPKVQEQITGYRQLLGQSSVEDIRRKSRLLVPKEGKEDDKRVVDALKAETAKRLLAYTEEGAQEGFISDKKDSWKCKWFTLNYSKVGADHLTGVGLGDILLDPDIKEISC